MKRLCPIAISILLSPCFLFGFATNKTEAFDALKKADAAIEQENYQEASAFYNLALPYFKASKDWYHLTHIYLWKGEIAYVEGDYSGALNLTLEGKRLADSYMHADTLSFYSMVLQNLGVFYSALGDFDNQLKHYQLAFEHALKFHGKESQQAADAYMSMGVAYGRRGDWPKCISYTDSSLQISRAIDYNGGVASAYLNLAHSFAVKEDFSKAIDYQNQALLLTESKEELARGYNNLGMYYNDLGEVDLALDYLDEALNMRLNIYRPDHDNVLSTLLNFARVHFDEGDLDKNELFIDRVIESGLAAAKDNQAYLKVAYSYKAINLLEKGDYTEALNYYKKALIVDGRQLQVDASVSLVGARILLRMKRYDEALTTIQEAITQEIEGFQSTHLYDNPNVEQIGDIEIGMDLLEKKAEILFEKAKQENDPKILEMALVVYQMLDALIMRSRSTYTNSVSKNLLSANSHSIYAGAIAVLQKLYDQTADPFYFEEALSYSEKNKSLSLSEKLNDLHAKSFGNIPANIVQRERQLLQEIEFYSNQITNRRNSAGATMLAQWQQKVFEKRQERDALLSTIRSSYKKYYDLRYNLDMPSPQQIRAQLLAKNEIFIEYFVAEEAVNIFLISSEEEQLIRVPIKQNFTALVEGFRNSILSQGGDFWSTGYQLYQYLFEPIAARIQGKDLFIVPDGVLGYIPFEALLTAPITADSTNFEDFPYLLKEHSLRFNFSAHASMPYLEKTKRSHSGEVLALAPLFENKTGDGNLAMRSGSTGSFRGLPDLSPLPGTLLELESLKALFRGQFLQAEAASEMAFKQNAPNYSLLHVATHTLIDDRLPGLSKLVFSSKEDEEDGFLHAYELYNMDLNSDLVTLSACNTGYGKLQKGEGIASLARAFAYAGSPNMVMSLWQVKDQTTPVIMDRFYKKLNEGKDKHRALKEAKIEFINQQNGLYSHPYFWACFMYLGDANPIYLAKAGAFDLPVRPVIIGIGLLLFLAFLSRTYLRS